MALEQLRKSDVPERDPEDIFYVKPFSRSPSSLMAAIIVRALWEVEGGRRVGLAFYDTKG